MHFMLFRQAQRPGPWESSTQGFTPDVSPDPSPACPPPWDAQEVEQLTANVMRLMLFRQAQRPDQPVRREDMRLAMGRHQSLGVAGHIIALAQAREPALQQQQCGLQTYIPKLAWHLATGSLTICNLRATPFARA